MLTWTKHGLLYAPRGDRPWERQYALLPTPIALDERVLRVYYSSLDDQRFGSVGFLDLDADTLAVLDRSPGPVLSPGPLGLFDDSGVNASSVVRHPDGSLWMYYVGWQRAERVPYLLFSGLATSTDQGRTFTRARPTPVLDRCPEDPFIRSAPSVLFHEGRWHAWYVSASTWDRVNGTQYPVYEIRHAQSPDGLDWKADPSTAVKHQDPAEFGFGRPWVLLHEGTLRMWYSIRSRTSPYRVGYAESADGQTWVRRDELAGIAASASGWDSEMLCYAAVIRTRSRWLMFFNGNRHGSTGFGVASAPL